MGWDEALLVSENLSEENKIIVNGNDKTNTQFIILNVFEKALRTNNKFQ